MNEKNIKKQSSAQSLDPDSLENVSGGYEITSINFTEEEANWLNDRGYHITTNSGYKARLYPRISISAINDSNENKIKASEIAELLDRRHLSN